MNVPEVCWYCQGVNTMREDKLGATCAKCGATWCPPVRSANKVLENGNQPDGQGGRKRTPGAGAIIKRRKS